MENEPHVIVLMHMEDYEDSNATVDVELIVDKCREGEIGIVHTRFEKPFLRFTEARTPDSPAPRNFHETGDES